MICPICGASSREAKNCSKYKKIICIECCKKCSSYEDDKTYHMHRCRLKNKKNEA